MTVLAEGALDSVAADETAVTAGAGESAAEKQSSASQSSLPDINLGTSHAPKVLVAEFIACMVLIGITPLLGGEVDAATWIKRGAACTGLFLVLSLVASGGPKASRIAAAFGGLVTLGLCITDRAVFAQIVALLGGGGDDTSAADDAAGEANAVVADDGED